MRDDDFPTPVSDPESEGLPETADDDSSASESLESVRAADGPDPASLPSDQPLAIDRFGTTAEEQRQGESLDAKLAREALEPPADDPLAAPADPLIADEAVGEEAARQASRDAEIFAEAPIDPNTGSAVSMYDIPEREPVGRLVADDEGAHTDEEPESVAHDVGADAGGASAEERAIHETRAP
ncbi:DUF5709 domain-containing protein [Micromonospora sp. CPCC 206061]|uniref:DUF5709 domain-containing protein n=1 Tax=Micromonospora sp. CPCC 206061 TaxID=3122410 RepID=UPI002FF02CA4